MAEDGERINGPHQAQHVALSAGTLCIDGRPLELDGYDLLSELGRGANGVVLKAFNRQLNDFEAIKVWLKLRDGDHRNKLSQGLDEINKLARAASPAVIRVNNWKVVDGHFVGFLEYIDGRSLKAAIAKYKDNPLMRIELAKMYLFRLRDMAAVGLFHGDPHLKNVMAYQVIDGGNTGVGIKFLDFGVSNSYGNKSAAERQNRIVWNTIRKMCGGIDSFDFSASSMKWALEEFKGKDFLWHSYWTDVLNDALVLELHKS